MWHASDCWWAIGGKATSVWELCHCEGDQGAFWGIPQFPQSRGNFAVGERAPYSAPRHVGRTLSLRCDAGRRERKRGTCCRPGRCVVEELRDVCLWYLTYKPGRQLISCRWMRWDKYVVHSNAKITGIVSADLTPKGTIKLKSLHSAVRFSSLSMSSDWLRPFSAIDFIHACIYNFHHTGPHRTNIVALNTGPCCLVHAGQTLESHHEWGQLLMMVDDSLSYSCTRAWWHGCNPMFFPRMTELIGTAFGFTCKAITWEISSLPGVFDGDRANSWRWGRQFLGGWTLPGGFSNPTSTFAIRPFGFNVESFNMILGWHAEQTWCDAPCVIRPFSFNGQSFNMITEEKHLMNCWGYRPAWDIWSPNSKDSVLPAIFEMRCLVR